LCLLNSCWGIYYWVGKHKNIMQVRLSAHACNPSSSGDWAVVQGQPRQEVSKTPTSINKLCMVAHVCRSSYWGGGFVVVWNITSQKERGAWLKWYIACLARMRPLVQKPVPPKKMQSKSLYSKIATYCHFIKYFPLH
jgi:hypothetical protein